jgi:hypothetical protein
MTAGSMFRRQLPKSWSWALLGVTGFGAIVALGSVPRMHVYLKYWGGPSPSIAMPWQALSADMDEKALLAAAPLPLKCIEQSKASNGLGGRVCYGSLDAVDGAPALGVAFFLDEGRLAHAVVQVPWWAHHRAARQAIARLGMPEAIQDRPAKGNRLMQWRLANGLVEINRDPGWNPLQWGAIYWKAERPARR